MVKIIVFLTLILLGILGVIAFSKNTEQAAKPTDLFGVTPLPTKIAKKTPTPLPPTVTPLISTAATKSAEKAATQAAILTSKGEIVIDLYRKDAPNTVKNFETKAKNEFYKNLTFHRVEDWVIQGGDPKGNGTGGGEIKTEINKKPFVIGSVGVARGGNKEISNDAQFFITKKDASWLNGEYTNFGMVKKGMDIVEKIAIGDKILGITLR